MCWAGGHKLECSVNRTGLAGGDCVGAGHEGKAGRTLLFEVQIDVIFYHFAGKFLSRFPPPPIPTGRPSGVFWDVVIEKFEDLNTQTIIGVGSVLIRHDVLKVLVNLFSDVFET